MLRRFDNDHIRFRWSVHRVERLLPVSWTVPAQQRETLRDLQVLSGPYAAESERRRGGLRGFLASFKRKFLNVTLDQQFHYNETLITMVRHLAAEARVHRFRDHRDESGHRGGGR